MQDRREAGGRGDVDLGAQKESQRMSQGDERGAVGHVKTNALKFRRGVASPRMLGSGESNGLAVQTRAIYHRSKRLSPPWFSRTAGELSQPALIKNNELLWFFRETADELSVRVTERPPVQMCPSGRGFEILRRPRGGE